MVDREKEILANQPAELPKTVHDRHRFSNIIGSSPAMLEVFSTIDRVAKTQATVLLITDTAARRPVPLPVAMRVELSRREPERLSLRIAKDQRGRITSPRSLAWAQPDAATMAQGWR